MTLQGTNDTNVTILQSIKLIDDLLKRAADVRVRALSGRGALLRPAYSWVDAFGKMETFFDRYLQAGARPPATAPSGAR